jgi:outer membrane protein OmpA-like peptidoglycan-associated protein
MKRLVGFGVAVAMLGAPSAAAAQGGSGAAPQTSGATTETRPALTTASGTTGLWFVPTAEVLPHKKWSVSFYRTNFDDGQGFSDVSTFPATFAVGLGGRAELFGSWALVTRIDRDTRPLFFEGANPDGTGGGILVDYPFVRKQWTGNQLGDFWVGGKVNLLADSTKPVGVALRGQVKLPVGNDDEGTSSGKPDFIVDGVVSTRNPVVELSGYGGVIVRGNPDGYDLTNGLRWGIGAGFPQRFDLGFRVTAELFGERYFDTNITAPTGLFGSDGSPVPTTTTLKSPVIASVGITWQAPNGFFVGAAASWNLHMSSRDNAGLPDEPKDDKGLQFRIGFHPGARDRSAPVAPPPPPAGPAGGQPVTPTPVTPPAANRPPTVRAACDPCTVEVGRTSTITATAQDPDGDPLTYAWTTAAGTVTSPTERQSPWTAPMQPGPVRVTVTVNDGKGGTATDAVTIQVIEPARKTYAFEDVHFDFDRFTLRPDAMRVLDEAITAMQADSTLRLEIEGHTCNIGTTEYNLALGERRARAVRDYLVSRGISGDRLRTISYGEERPKHDNSREETRRLNRRAGLVVNLR